MRKNGKLTLTARRRDLLKEEMTEKIVECKLICPIFRFAYLRILWEAKTPKREYKYKIFNYNITERNSLRKS